MKVLCKLLGASCLSLVFSVSTIDDVIAQGFDFSPDPVDFGDVLAGEDSAVIRLNISNNSGSALIVQAIPTVERPPVVSGPEFSFTIVSTTCPFSYPATIPDNTSCSLDATISVHEPGSIDTRFILLSDSPDSPHSVQIRANIIGSGPDPSSYSAYAPNIDTTNSPDGSGLSWFGELENPAGGTQGGTLGQIFTVNPALSSLDSFSFFLDDNLDPDEVDFKAYIMEWDGDSVTGPILYESDLRTTTNNSGLDGLEEFIFETGGIDLQGGVQYIAFLSSFEQLDGIVGRSSSRTAGDALPAGSFAFLNNVTDRSQWAVSSWIVREPRDLWFRASFTPRPRVIPVIPPFGILLLSVVMAFAAVRARA